MDNGVTGDISFTEVTHETQTLTSNEQQQLCKKSHVLSSYYIIAFSVFLHFSVAITIIKKCLGCCSGRLSVIFPS